MHVKFVTVKVKPEFHDAFIEGMSENARSAVAQEPGCFQFDIIQDANEPNTLNFYEVFKDEAAYDEHHTMEYQRKWSAMSKDWRDGPSVVRSGANAHPADGNWK